MQAIGVTMRKHYARGGRDNMSTLEKEFIIYAKKANYRRTSGPMFLGILGMVYGHKAFPFQLMPKPI